MFSHRQQLQNLFHDSQNGMLFIHREMATLPTLCITGKRECKGQSIGQTSVIHTSVFGIFL